MEYQVKVWKQLLLTWQKKIMKIEEDKFILKKLKSKSSEDKSYSLKNAVIIDKSKINDNVILIVSSSYKIHLKPQNKEEKDKIIIKLEEIIKKYSSKNAFSEEYQINNLELFKNYNNNTTPFKGLLYNLNNIQYLLIEISKKLDNFKNLIQNKGSSAEYMTVHNNLCTIKEEMKKQIDNIMVSVFDYHDLIEGKDNIDLNIKKENEEENLAESTIDNIKNSVISNSENEELKKEKINNTNIISFYKIYKNPSKNPYYFLSNIISDFYDPNFNFNTRKGLKNKIKIPENIVKEMMANITKKQSAPIYFNEPISIGQKQCEKFYYLDLLNKAANEEKKEMQLCYISAFIIGEIFLNIGRSLKPFNSIIGETYEYFNNNLNFRYYSEQVSHKPPINAYVGETPDFILYGDTLGDTSFKIFKGGMELSFTNKIHILFKKSGDHYTYIPPNAIAKGLMKPPMYIDYYGDVLIQNITNPAYKCELKFIEESWAPDSLGNFEGTVYNNDKIIYLLGGNWKNNIYMTDPDGNDKKDLLVLDQKLNYLNNTSECYYLPEFTCDLNNMTEELEKSLPLNDSRFKKDMRFLEEGNIDEAQKYKEKYEEKQRKELNNDQHKILFFKEEYNSETEKNYYVPNDQYWEMKKNNTLKDNCNANIFDVSNY